MCVFLFVWSFRLNVLQEREKTEFSKWMRLIGCGDNFRPQLLTPFYLMMTMTHWPMPPQTADCRHHITVCRRMRISLKTPCVNISCSILSDNRKNFQRRGGKKNGRRTMNRAAATIANDSAKKKQIEPHQIKCQTQSISHKVFKSVHSLMLEVRVLFFASFSSVGLLCRCWYCCINLFVCALFALSPLNPFTLISLPSPNHHLTT